MTLSRWPARFAKCVGTSLVVVTFHLHPDVSSLAFADETEPHTWSHFSISGGLDYGFGSDVHPFGVGMNSRVGLTQDNGIYTGIVGEYFWGSTVRDDSIPSSPLVYRYDTWIWMAEAGYDWEWKPNWVIRPKLGLGFAHWEYDEERFGPAENAVDTDLALSLGGQVLYPLTDHLQLSGELRFLFVGGRHSSSSLAPGINLGWKL